MWALASCHAVRASHYLYCVVLWGAKVGLSRTTGARAGAGTQSLQDQEGGRRVQVTTMNTKVKTNYNEYECEWAGLISVGLMGVRGNRWKSGYSRPGNCRADEGSENRGVIGWGSQAIEKKRWYLRASGGSMENSKEEVGLWLDGGADCVSAAQIQELYM